MPSFEATRKKLREARFFYSKFAEEERLIFRQEPEARDFYLSAFFAAARSTGDVMRAEAGDHYRAWWEASGRPSLSPQERELLRFTAHQRVQAVHVRGVRAENQVTEVPISELQRELGAKGGSVQITSPPGTPPPTTSRTTLFFDDYPEEAAVKICERYLRLLERLFNEYEAHAARRENG